MPCLEIFVRGLPAHYRLQSCVCLQIPAHHAPALADAALSKLLWSEGIVLDNLGLTWLCLLSNCSAANGAGWCGGSIWISPWERTG